MATLSQVKAEAEGLTDSEKKEVVEHLGGSLPAPGGSGLTVVWVVALLILAGIVGFFGWLSFEQAQDDKTYEAFMGVVTLAVGFLGGLFVPTPKP